MTKYILCMLLQRFLLPIVIAACFLFRPVGLSIPYLFLFFYLPLVPVATPKSMHGHTGHFLKIVIAVSVLMCLIQIAFQIVLVSIGPDFIVNCELLEKILRHVGLVKLDNLNIIYIVQWLAPEIVMLITSIGLFIVLRKMSAHRVRDLEENDAENLIETMTPPEVVENTSETTSKFFSNLGVTLSLFTLLVAGSMRPSIPSAIYFLFYLCAGTWWACYRSLSRGFAIVSRVVMVFGIAHIIALLSYQNPWPQEFLPSNSSIPRYFGLSKIFWSTCENQTDIRQVFINHNLELDSYLNPIAILLCYYTLGVTSSLLLKPKEDVKKKLSGFGQLENGTRITRQVSLKLRKSVIKKSLPAEKWRISARQIKVNVNRALEESTTVPNERTPLMRKSTKRLKEIKNDNTSTIAEESAGEIQMENIAKEVTYAGQPETNFVDQFVIGIETIAGVIYKNSYIFTNITMMAWSIKYHSWLTFVLLIWANILWMIPNQRKAMLRCSPFIVIYAIFLLIAQFVYGMDLTEDELPTKVATAGINLVQIGFIRYEHYPVEHLLIKSAFLVMFWITLRQLLQESKLRKQKSTLADMVAPLQVTVGAATADLAPNGDANKSSPFMKKFETFFNSFLLKSWIWLVMIVLFVSGMAGPRMTVFRIIYMALVLLFIILFQVSIKVWKTFMYGFWLFVIAYAMAILILVYTYQFDGFPDYWKNYLLIPEQLQKDIGLETYATKDLFLHLINPTVVVIMTVIQLHYFHKKYVQLFEVPTRQNSDNSRGTNNSSTNYGNVATDLDAETDNDDNDDDADPTIRSNSVKKPKQSIWKRLKIRKMSKKEIVKSLKHLLNIIYELSELLWIFLELHLIKFIMLAAFLLSVYNVCLLHVTFVILTVIAVASRSKLQILVSRIISIFVAIIFIAKMIYQVDYIHHDNYDVNCNETINPEGMNNADWFGLRKEQFGLAELLKSYIYYLIFTTFHAVVIFRQTSRRLEQGRSTRKPQVMFPKINRTNAEKNLTNMIKYLFNYGFYRFGIEVCLIAVVALIGSRLDLMACFYAIWLVSLFSLTRDRIACVWKFFILFIGLATIIQYIVMIGLPPGMCIDYKEIYDTLLMKKLQRWALLPDSSLRNQVKKLVIDFLVLLLCSRQNLAFRIEKRYSADDSEFPGGKNRDIVGDIDKRGFSLIENPTPDFTSHIRNWLDILKRGILLGFFWFTLAIVFLTGANRVNLFSIGYLVGSFIFLWQGSDFYLRPIRKILKLWTCLLGYNVFVISIKTFLQIAGCLFFEDLAGSCCWLIQLMGITCIDKFDKKVKNLNCFVPDEEVGLFWDGVCFGFLILQLRIFRSYYFCHIVNDTKASNILASRGAQLIEAYRAKQMKIQADHENEILQKIKLKMDRIKATQQKLQQQITEPETHAQERTAPLARSTSMSSCAGYHTPIEDEVATSVIIEGDGGSDLPSDVGPFTSRGGSILQTQVNNISSGLLVENNSHAASPSSAVMTVSLDGYLEPQRLSFGSPPGSDLLPRIPSLDESFPVFSPPPAEDATTTESTQSNTLIPSIVAESSNITVPQTTAQQSRQHRRQSSLNTVTWPDQNIIDGRTGRYATTLNPSDGNEESPVYRPRLINHRRQSSMGAASFRERRRSSYNSSYANDDDTSVYQPISSWGPIGEMYHRESVVSVSSRSPISHHEYANSPYRRQISRKRRFSSSKDAIRSGDYYMFEELDNKLDLNILSEASYDVPDEGDSANRLKRKLTVSKLLALKMKEDKEQVKRASALARHSSLAQSSTEPVPKESRSTMSEPISRISDSRVLLSMSQTDRDDDVTQPDGQQPSTSRGSDETHPDPSQEGDIKLLPKDDEGKEEKRSRLSGLIFIWSFIESILISITIRLNKVSRNYRYVMKVLAQEKKTLKSSEGFGMGLKISSALIWGQNPNSDTQQVEIGEGTSTMSSGSVSLDVVDSPRKSWASSTNIPTREATPPQDDDDVEKDGAAQKPLTPAKKSEVKERKTSVVPEIRILAPSLERGLDETAPQIKKSSPFDYKTNKDSIKPVEVADVGDFSTKEHSAIFELLSAIWFAILSHTDFVCYFMVFLNQVKSASVLSLPLPLMVFFWGTLTIPRPSKTFWITLIAYTQTVVLLKCISQFEIMWWNREPIPPNMPLAPARILGIEKKKYYATYDLILLLVVFFHRFMLKSMGLWKSEFKEETMKDAAYKAQNGNLENDDDNKQVVLVKDGDKQLIKTGSESALVGSHSDAAQDSNTVEEQEILFPGIIRLSIKKYSSSTKNFFGHLLGPASRATRDVYAYMFICDFINFLVLLFGFTAFGSTEGDGGVQAYIEENKVPITFLVMLLLQFVLIIIDRALYLRKYMLGKIIFQYVLVVVIHIWMFFILPGVTERNFNTKNPPVIWYMIKCFYLLLSAFQIRCGYPTRILGNFLTKGFTIVNGILHKIFMLIPFLFELRTLMDWIWTDTTMTLFDWLKMEDIFVNIYQQKCSRTMESDFPQPRGTKKKTLSKYLVGGGMLCALIALIWFPLALFALGNTVGEPNPPFDVSVSLRIGPYEPVYSMSAQDSNILTFSANDYYKLQRKYSTDRTALTFLSAYEADDISAIKLAANSTSIWNISPPDHLRLLHDIESNNTLTCRFRYTVSRKTYAKENPSMISEETKYEMASDDPYRQNLYDMLANQSDSVFVLPHMFPKFLKVKNLGNFKPAPQLLGPDYNENETAVFRNFSLKLFHNMNTTQMWWEVKEPCIDPVYNEFLKDIPYADCQSSIVMYLFNDKLFPSKLSLLTSGGIIGMYTSFVILFSRIIRGVFSGMSSKIMFDDLPYVDRVLQLCLDIYLVREVMEFTLEEDLFSKLIFLYRSPETMIKWTRPKEEGSDDEGDAPQIGNDGDDDDDDGGDVSSGDKNNLRRRKASPEKAE